MVSLSRYLRHYNLDYFPAPESFKPERWLGKDDKELEKWNFSFSKGIRRCLGLPDVLMLFLLLFTV
ncbi:hypothetical protein N7520_000610 [Penicillium odoratum]|uniref:uncharacterized protein n=1 Tax=Penicillium odoratum TaxID=1167516 RepID=UPI002546A590|nr:uncharacterized protein N7520_000610 [Penicillium odoratum]KAJ5777364.1 hypothetical protein N7520_000610 [Penicillium odoratum]